MPTIDDRTSSAPPSLVGVVLSERYRIDRLLGEGGMGAVYLAEHLHMHKRLAVKVLHPEMSRLPEVVARFEREALAAGHIDHPNVATASDFGQLPDGSFFLVLEYIEGTSLREVISRGPLSLSRALHIARQIADALGGAHSLGIVHRDLKPENVMILARNGDPDFVKVLDFGIAKVPVGTLGTGTTSEAPGPALTRLGAVFGTPDYMSPEQALGQSIDGRADLYSLGVLLFEMLAGVTPFEHENAATVLSMHLTAPVPLIASKATQAIPPDVEALVSRALAKDAGERFQEAGELALALGSARAHLPDTEPVASRRASSAEHVADASTSAPTHAALGAPEAALTHFIATLETVGRGAWTVARRLFAKTDKQARTILMAASASLVVVLGLIVLVVTAGGSAARPEPSLPLDSSTPTSPSKEAPPPARANPHADLERADMAEGDTAGALAEAGEWIATDPAASADARLAVDLRSIALAQESPDSAVALLARMDAVGVDALYDLAYNAGPGAASSASRKALASAGVAPRASPSLTVTLEIREARSCDKKKAVFDRARQLGDARTLAVLRDYQSTSGCGFLRLKDCWRCMRRDDSLASTIHAIQQRESGN